MKTKNTEKHALIVGAGIAGLTAAWWLKFYGWKVTIIEKTSSISSNGYMLSLSSTGYDVATKMSILPELEKHHKEIGINYYLDKNGKEVLRHDFQEISKVIDWVTLSRADLASVIYDHVIDKIKIKFSTTLACHQETQSGIEAVLSDGSKVTADLLIGADGVRSALRKELFSEDSVCVEKLGYRFAAFEIETQENLSNDFISYTDPGRLTQLHSLSKKCVTALYIWRDETSAYIKSNQARKEILKQAFGDSHVNAQKWIGEVAQEQTIYLDDMAMVSMKKWSKGRVVLLGDAAHCLTLLSGQGAGTAMTSAYLLAKLLVSNEIDDALVKHEALLRPSVERLQERSRNIALWFIPKTRFGFAFRSLIMKCMPKRFLTRYFLKSIESDVLDAKLD